MAMSCFADAFFLLLTAADSDNQRNHLATGFPYKSADVSPVSFYFLFELAGMKRGPNEPSCVPELLQF